MFKHQGKRRTAKHNLQIATALSLVAGIVNVSGYLSIQKLTTNVTGHFAMLIYDVSNFEFWKSAVYLLYIFSFLFGTFSSSFLIELFRENKKLNVFVIPTLMESVILITIAVLSDSSRLMPPNLIACLLLFAMGLQNSFVTKISNAVVRTTHLTGLFTDLGIEISQLFFPSTHPHQQKIKETIKLRIYIISNFFLGIVIGGLLYSKFNLKLNTLLFGVLILISSLYYDDFKFRIITGKRKYKSKIKASNNRATKNLIKFHRKVKSHPIYTKFTKKGQKGNNLQN